METLFHARPYGKFIEIQGETNFINNFRAPIFLEVVLVIKTM